jgi:hypothetical protein
MVCTSLSEITCWGNFYSRLPGALGLSPSHRGGLRAPVLCGPGRAGRAGHRPPPMCLSAVFVRSVQPHGPPTSRFLVRPPPEAHRRPHPWGGRASVSLHTLPVQAMLTSMVLRSGTGLPCAKEK